MMITQKRKKKQVNEEIMEILLRTPPHQNPKEFSTPCTTSQNPLHQGGTKEPERKER